MKSEEKKRKTTRLKLETGRIKPKMIKTSLKRQTIITPWTKKTEKIDVEVQLHTFSTQKQESCTQPSLDGCSTNRSTSTTFRRFARPYTRITKRWRRQLLGREEPDATSGIDCSPSRLFAPQVRDAAERIRHLRGGSEWAAPKPRSTQPSNVICLHTIKLRPLL